MSEDSFDLYDGIESEPPKRAKKTERKTEFSPWHRPRKQCIRKYQWASEVAELLDKLDLSEKRPLKYLTLPAADFMDIRVLHDEVKSQDVVMKYMGFNTQLKSDDTQLKYELQLAEFEVTQLDNIDGNSKIYPDDFRDLSSEKSNAYEQIKHQGSFDAINLDLCDSIASQQPSDANNYFSAVNELLELQGKNRTEPWILFVSTHISRESVNSEVIEALVGVIQDNIQKSEEFRIELERITFIPAKEIQDVILSHFLGANDEAWSAVFDCFCLGLGKWFLQLMLGSEPRWTVSLQKSYFYSVSGSEKDFAALCFKFDQISEKRIDRTGLGITSPEGGSSEDPEIKCAKNILSQVASLEDVDEYLIREKEVWETLKGETRDILDICHYDVDKYDEWIKDVEGSRKASEPESVAG